MSETNDNKDEDSKNEKKVESKETEEKPTNSTELNESEDKKDEKKKDDCTEKKSVKPQPDSPVVDYKEEYFKQVLSDDQNYSVPGFKDIIFSIFKQLTIGMDLSKVMLPVELCESRSLLEKLTDIMTHINIMLKVPKCKTGLERMVEICRWAVSGWYIRPRGAKKPFNPVLGEVFRGHWTMEDKSISTFFSEQVSHHPPISAFFGENKTHRMRMEGWYYPQSRFLGNSCAAIAEGKANLYCMDLDETYTLTWPDYYFRGLFWGTLKLEIGGTINIECKKTGYSAFIKFIPKPLWGGEWYTIEGKIRKGKATEYYISGKWTETVYIQRKISLAKKGEKKIFFDTKNSKRCPMQVLPVKSLEDYESHKLWYKACKAVDDMDIDVAREEKHSVEEAQRDKRRYRAENNVKYKNRFFEKNEKTKGWKFLGEEDKMYKILLKRKFRD